MTGLLAPPRPHGASLVARRLNRLPYFLTVNRPDNSITLVANDKSTVLSMGISGMGPALLSALAAKATSSSIYVNMMASDGKRDIPLSNSGIHFATIFGSNLFPYRLPETLVVDELRRLKIELTDFSGSSNTLRFSLRAHRNFNAEQDPNADVARTRLEDKVRITYPFFYVPDAGKIALSSSGTAEIPITIFPHHDFLLYQITHISTRDSNGGAVNFNYDLVDANTGRSVINAPGDQHYNVSSTLMSGTSQVTGGVFYSFRFRVPRLFKAGQRLILFLSNPNAFATSTWITLGGVHAAVRLWGETP